MNDKISSELINKIEVVPDYIQNSSNRAGSEKFDHLAVALKVMEAGQGVVYSPAEFKQLFGAGKHVPNYLKKALRDRGVNKPCVIFNSTKVYIFNRTKV